jgi:hypothetical protein
LYCAAQRISLKACEDLSSSLLRRQLQGYFDSLGTFPPANSPDEYAFYFEATYKDPADRRAVIDRYVSGASPSYGHRVLAILLSQGKARIVWTPNFDRLIEDSAVKAFGGTSRIVVASLDSASLALQAMNEGRWPLICKLHGDFQSRRLKNTADELREQDSELRRALVESCKRHGLIVVGYSGRDQSVMAALEEAISGGHGYPNGLFWFHRPGSVLLDPVSQLIERAKSAGVQAWVIEAQTFDELMGDVVRQFDDIPPRVLEELGATAKRVTEIAPEAPGSGWPVVRLNALPFLEWPSVCRRVACTIGGTKEVRDVVQAAGANVLVARRNVGVLAFGDDEAIRNCFSAFKITAFDFHSIEPARLRYESAELGLIRDALARGISRSRPLFVHRRRTVHFLGAIADDPSSLLNSLKKAVGQLTGTVPGTTLKWAEAIRVRVEHRLERLWLVFEPTIWFESTEDDEQRYVAGEFVRQRTATRYNQQWNSLIAAWATILQGDLAPLKAFDTADGTDAIFRLGTTTAFSRRAQKR